MVMHESSLLEEDEYLTDDAEYGEQDFDYYSDSFENEEPNNNDTSSTSVTTKNQQHKVWTQWSKGNRVQVYWRDENEWFDGTIEVVDTAHGRFFVYYDDGEQAWETEQSIRVSPEVISFFPHQYDQLQQLSTDQCMELKGRTVLVYWTDEHIWYQGQVVAINTSSLAIQIAYDDGEIHWEQEPGFVNIILLTKSDISSSLSPQHCAFTESTPISPPQPSTERIIVPRPYQQTIQNHFQPERYARPYISVVQNHSRSTIIGRPYCERRYLHIHTLDCAIAPRHIVDDIQRNDSITQTNIMGAIDIDNIIITPRSQLIE